LKYISSFAVLKFYGVVEVLPVVQYVFLVLFILEISEQFIGKREEERGRYEREEERGNVGLLSLT
jgi:hypothetical protein